MAHERGGERSDSPWIERAVWFGLGVQLIAAFGQAVIGEQYLGVRSGTYDASAVIDPANLPWALTWAYPLSISGLTVVSLGVGYLMRHAETAHLRRYPWAVMLGAGSLSVAANFLHGPLALRMIPWEWWAAGAWSSIPSISFIAGAHLVYVLKRSGERAAATARFTRQASVAPTRQEPREATAERRSETLPLAAPERPTPPAAPRSDRRRRPVQPRLQAPRTHVPRLLAEIARERGIHPAQVDAGDVAERLGFERKHSSVRRWVSVAKSTFRPEPAVSGREVAA